MPANRRPVLLNYFIRGGHRGVDSLLQSLVRQGMSILAMQDAVVDASAPRFLEVWQRLISEASSARPVVLIIDGLDELAARESIGSWLLGSLVDYVHVILTSRPSVDLRTLVPRDECHCECH